MANLERFAYLADRVLDDEEREEVDIWVCEDCGSIILTVSREDLYCRWCEEPKRRR